MSVETRREFSRGEMNIRIETAETRFLLRKTLSRCYHKVTRRLVCLLDRKDTGSLLIIKVGAVKAKAYA